MGMATAAAGMFDDPQATMELLWRLNKSYSQRLGKARSRLELLSHLLTDRQADHVTHEVVEVVLRECGQIYEEYQRWRFTYFYESPEDKRMVQDLTGLGRALAQFARMRQRHAQRASQITAHLNHYRPPAAWTTIAQGDLWTLTAQAFSELQTLEYVG